MIRAAPDVSPALRRRVEQAMRELHYEPYARLRIPAKENLNARIISFTLSNRSLQHPLHCRILQGVESFCAEADYAVVYKAFRYSAQAEPEDLSLPAFLQERGIANSLILAGTNYGNLLRALAAHKIPHVKSANNVLDESLQDSCDQVRFDDIQGASDATKYLLELGHRDICFIGDPSTPWCRGRYAAYVRTMEEAGLKPNELAGGVSDDQNLDGQHTLDLLLEQKVSMSAILAGTEETVRGVRESLRRHRIEVPRDISLIGFDDQYEEQRILGITTVHVDSEEIGRQLARVAIQKLKDPQSPVPEVVVPTKLVRRSSCRPVFENVRNASGA